MKKIVSKPITITEQLYEAQMSGLPARKAAAKRRLNIHIKKQEENGRSPVMILAGIKAEATKKGFALEI